MNQQRQEALRKLASTLRLKSSQGVLAVAAAKDIQQRVPQFLREAVEKDLSSGELAERWKQALAKAEAELEEHNPTSEELQVAALCQVLAWHHRLTKQALTSYAEETELQRKLVEGRAAGIEEALGVLTAPEEDAGAPGADAGE